VVLVAWGVLGISAPHAATKLPPAIHYAVSLGVGQLIVSSLPTIVCRVEVVVVMVVVVVRLIIEYFVLIVVGAPKGHLDAQVGSIVSRYMTTKARSFTRAIGIAKDFPVLAVVLYQTTPHAPGPKGMSSASYF